jgi:hypothetical protein
MLQLIMILSKSHLLLNLTHSFQLKVVGKYFIIFVRAILKYSVV